MKHFLIIFAICLKQFYSFGQNKDTLPGILDVARNFYSHYSVSFLEYPRVFFEKRPEGWFVLTKKIENNQVIDDKRVLFYTFSTQNFHTLDFPKKSKQIIDLAEYVDPFDLQFFDVYPH